MNQFLTLGLSLAFLSSAKGGLRKDLIQAHPPDVLRLAMLLLFSLVLMHIVFH